MSWFARIWGRPQVAQPPPSPPALRSFGPGTISAALVRRVALLVVVTAILLDASAVVVARQVWLTSLDSELHAALSSGRTVYSPSSTTQGPYATELELIISGGQLQMAVAFDREQGTTLNQLQVNAVMRIRPDGRVYTVNVPGLGPYRVAGQMTRDGQRIAGVSMRSMSAALSRLLLVEAALTLAAAIAAALVAFAVVRMTLRPLTALMHTATRVAGMRLDQGEVNLGRLSGVAVDPSSEVGQVGLALNHMLDNVEDALVARQRSEAKVRAFVADASHELRNPLASIRGYAELMGRDKDMPAQQAFAVDRITVESRRMSTLVDQMLLLARLDQGRPMGWQRVDVTQLLVDAVMDATVAGPDHHWKLDVPDDPIEIDGDQNQIHEVIANLLGNARKHTPPDTHVLATLRRVQGPLRQVSLGDALQYHVVLTVSDDGPGIPAGLQEHIFERFVRADQARTHDAEGSAGLGLAIVAGVVAAHGGQVGVQSVPGATSFTVLLPGAAVVPQVDPAPTTP